MKLNTQNACTRNVLFRSSLEEAFLCSRSLSLLVNTSYKTECLVKPNISVHEQDLRLHALADLALPSSPSTDCCYFPASRCIPRGHSGCPCVQTHWHVRHLSVYRVYTQRYLLGVGFANALQYSCSGFIFGHHNTMQLISTNLEYYAN
jgi:hypothetical protein